MTDPPAVLSIGDLAERSGVPAATLRSWEERYGFPAPRRLSGGHRRYDERDVELVMQVVRRRDSGLRLSAAVESVMSDVNEHETSVFAGLRRRHPDLVAQVVAKSTLLALTRAMEDECCAQAERPVLFASFQRERFYRQSRSRWVELARTARTVVVFADFAKAPLPLQGAVPLTVTVARDARLAREWVLICDAPDFPACVAGWEHPGQDAVPDARRQFETVWSLEPQVVRHAAHIAAGLATTFAPRLERRMAGLFAGSPVAAGMDLRTATGLLTRMVGYLNGMPR